MATYEIGNGCESSIEAVLASNQKRRRVNSFHHQFLESAKISQALWVVRFSR
jgi:hypothetical protein